ncbi:MAG: helix-turn-helix domain-containing protein [Blautia sp.]
MTKESEHFTSEEIYMINTTTLEEVCNEASPGFAYFASICNPHLFPGSEYPWHWHSYAQCFYVLEGQIDYQLPSGTFRFKKGDGGYINSNILHKMACRTSGTCLFTEQLFAPSFIGGFVHNVIMTKYVLPITNNSAFEIFCFRQENPDHQELIEHLKNAYELFKNKDDCFELLIRVEYSLFWSKFYKLTGEYRNTLSGSHSSARIKAMLHYINEHYMQKITLDEIAAAGACSTRECNRSFKNELHTTPFEYLAQIRMNKAVGYLTTTSYPITLISEMCGFSDPSHFTKSFKAIYHMSPKEFRRTGGISEETG